MKRMLKFEFKIGLKSDENIPHRISVLSSNTKISGSLMRIISFEFNFNQK